MKRSIYCWLIVGSATFLPRAANACAVCMGGNDSTIGPAMNAAIFSLLGIVLSIGAGFLGFIFYLLKRGRSPLPSWEDLNEE
jgi:hypothetical protein